MWTILVDAVRATIFAGSHVLNGSLGGSIILVTAVVRLALIPLAIRAARHARAQQARLAAIEPQLQPLRTRWASEPGRLMTETQLLHRKHGIQPIGRDSLVSSIIQLPLAGALFSAVRSGLASRVRFLWVADLGRPDLVLIGAAVVLTGISAVGGPGPVATSAGPKLMTAAVMAATLMFLWSASSAVALSVGTGSAISLLQSWFIRRDAARA